MKNGVTLTRVVLATIISFNLTLSHGQTGPAGVGNSSSNKVWLDAHSINSIDGSLVSSWADLSGNGMNFVQGTGLRQPIYSSLGIAGLPAVTFDGINDVLVSPSNPALETNTMTYFMVYDRTTLTSDIMINMGYASPLNKYRTYSNNGQNTIISAQYSPSINWVRYTDPPGASFFSFHATPTTIQTYSQGTLAMTKTATNVIPTTHQNITLGNKSAVGTGSYIFTGEIAEVVVFNTTLNPLQRILVENYLGAKYNMAIPTDHYDYDATHQFGLIALANDGVNSQTIAQGSGILELSGATDLGSNEYFVIAHTDFSPDEYNLVNLPASLPDHLRLERTWRVDETGETGTTTLTFRLSDYDFAVDTSYRLLVDTDADFADATVVSGVYDAITQTVTFDINLSDGDYFTLAGILQILDIHSITDGLWSETTTWDCSCIPSNVDNVYIDPGTTVTVDINGFTDFLSIEFGGTLIMDSDVTLDINGDWNIIGDGEFTNGEIALTGDSSQTVALISTGFRILDFNDLIINNTSSDDVLFLFQTFRLNGLLSPISGNIVIDPSTTFIISSTSGSAGGRVGPIIPPTNFTGEFTVQRNIPPGLADWRDLASPVIGSTFDTWDPDLAMSGPGFPDGCAWGPDDCFKSVTFTNNSILNIVLNSSDPITNTRGYEIFVGTDLATFVGTTLNSRGTLNTSADIVQTLNTGWTTIGNPYASPIAFSTLAKTGSIGNYFYVYDPASGAYEWYDGASGSTSLPEITEDGLISTGQGIWVFASSIGTITYTQFDKVENTATFIRSHDIDNSLHLVMKENGSTYSATVRMEEMDGAIDGADETIDIRHLETGIEKAPSLAVSIDDQKLRKNYIANNGRDKSFELYTKFINEGYYTFSLENWSNFRSYNKILLFDRETGETVNLKENGYTFFAAAADAGRAEASRFTLILSNSAEAATEVSSVVSLEDVNESITIKQFGKIIDFQAIEEVEETSTITVTNVLGQNVVYAVTTNLVNGSNLITLPSDLNGFYIISVQTGGSIVTKKLML